MTNLQDQRIECLKKIKEIERDLKHTLDQELDQNACDEESREILNQLYNLEKENLNRIDQEIFYEKEKLN
jgi:hypothetical protein